MKWVKKRYRSSPDGRAIHGVRWVAVGAGIKPVVLINLWLMIVITIMVFANPVLMVLMIVLGVWLSFAAVLFMSPKYGLAVNSIQVPDVRGLNGVLLDLAETMQRVEDVRSLTPEGTGYLERLDEFGRLTYLSIEEVSRIPRGDAMDQPYWDSTAEIREKLLALRESGEALVSLVRRQRVESVRSSFELMGISEYAEHLSVETAVHRALGPGGREAPDNRFSMDPAIRKWPPRE